MVSIMESSKDRSIVWLIDSTTKHPIAMERWQAPLEPCRGANGIVRALCFDTEAEAATYVVDHHSALADAGTH
jgi:hypothetical protein